ncbi:hypothetical protein AVEN_94358-1 [Araneus ventricosus]|uniref:Uncharacterized protein n=1 Tax=Araneus ventricosus TaxID=182803 RepID=A0A4Y2E9P6_ARAVE|nr:hypothetical protein AVEN_94358-1 [Araneus ventricosus]
MLKRYHKRPEAVNLVELEMSDATQIDNDLDFPFIETNPNIYDFQEITESSALSERLEPDQIDWGNFSRSKKSLNLRSSLWMKYHFCIPEPNYGLLEALPYFPHLSKPCINLNYMQI